MTAYFDTSVITKCYLPEPDSLRTCPDSAIEPDISVELSQASVSSRVGPPSVRAPVETIALRRQS